MTRRLAAVLTQLALISALSVAKTNGGADKIKPEDLREWLNFIASDELDGRATFSEGLGVAAGYISAQLKSWGVKPGGTNGTYLQKVPVLGVKSTNRSRLTVEANGQTRTFNNREGVSFPANVGGKRSFTCDKVEFIGYGLFAPQVGHNDYDGHDVKGKVAVFLGSTPPKAVDARRFGRAMFARGRAATEERGAVATIAPVIFGRGQGQRPQAQASGQGAPTQSQGQATAQGQSQAQAAAPSGQQQSAFSGGFGGPDGDFTTVQRLDNPIPPSVTAQDEFFDFLFSGAETKYADLKAMVAAGEKLPEFTLKNVRITFKLDCDYEVVRTQYTRNVVGVIEGSDPKLKDTYVFFGAHYDHVGYAEGEITQGVDGPRRAGARGRVTEGAIQDRIWNGADDDGSGTVTMLGIAKAFATGPRPRRSVVLVWHSGEERGLWGSRYYADYPTVPIDKIVAQVNMDMVGRNRDNKEEESNTVYLVGSDRISTELHNLSIDANAALSKPLKLDFEMNDPSDLEQIYYRSDHYSYAAKGIPIVFLTTGLHQDYHANTDSAEKINYEKMARIGQFAYEIGFRAANLDHAPVRDNQGPRIGKGSAGKLQ
ncbi:MAG TPA: M28 family peptidase [Blastocatellia bacterium]|nr:M28 family peptidase [Blastocatellia bacterium]